MTTAAEVVGLPLAQRRAALLVMALVLLAGAARARSAEDSFLGRTGRDAGDVVEAVEGVGMGRPRVGVDRWGVWAVGKWQLRRKHGGARRRKRYRCISGTRKRTGIYMHRYRIRRKRRSGDSRSKNANAKMTGASVRKSKRRPRKL